MSSDADRLLDEWRQLTSAAVLPTRRVVPTSRPVARGGLLTLTAVLAVCVAVVAVYFVQFAPSNHAAGPSSPPRVTAPAPSPTATPAEPSPPTSAEPTPAISPTDSPPTPPTATPIAYPNGAADQLLVMEVTGGGAPGGTLPPGILFDLYGNGRLVFRELVPGLSESHPMQAWLTPDEVQHVLSFVRDSGFLGLDPLYPFTTFGPAGSTIIELKIAGLDKRVEYQLPPGNLVLSTNPATEPLRTVASALMAFDPRQFVGPGESPPPSPSDGGRPTTGIWNGTTVSVVVSIDGSDVASVAPGYVLDPIPGPDTVPHSKTFQLRTPDGFILFSKRGAFPGNATAYLNEPCGQIIMWWGTAGPGTLSLHRDAATCGPATASPSPSP